MLLVRRLKKKPSVAPKKKRVASLLLRRPLKPNLLQRLLRWPSQFAKAHQLWRLLQLLRPIPASATNSAVRTSHVPMTAIVAVAAMASAKTLRIVLRSRKRLRLHALPHVLPTKKAMASVVVVAARPS
ncbi:hypothetical protein D3C75_924280 [compost metagenome]